MPVRLWYVWTTWPRRVLAKKPLATQHQTDTLTDAVPKKRGPKTDVLEALLKRVDGLEARLKHEKKSEQEANADEGQSVSPDDSEPNTTSTISASVPHDAEPQQKRQRAPTIQAIALNSHSRDIVPSPPLTSEPPIEAQQGLLLDNYFTEFHGKPYHIVEEAAFRHRYHTKQLPSYLLKAMFAVAARYVVAPWSVHLCHGYVLIATTLVIQLIQMAFRLRLSSAKCMPRSQGGRWTRMSRPWTPCKLYCSSSLPSRLREGEGRHTCL